MKKLRRDALQLIFWLSVGFVAVLVTATAARASDVTWEAMPENGRQVAAISDGARIWAGNYACVMHNPQGAPDIDTDALLAYLMWSVTERTNLTLDYRGETTATVVDGCIVIQWQTALEMWTERGSLSVKGFTASRYYATTGVIVSARMVLQSTDFTGDYRLATHTAMHEMGHAIGIAGHSPHEHDVMHSTRKHGRYAMTANDWAMTRYAVDVCHAELTPHGDVYLPGISGAGVTLSPSGGLLYLTHEHHSGETCTGQFDGDAATVHEVRSVDETYLDARIERSGGGWLITDIGGVE